MALFKVQVIQDVGLYRVHFIQDVGLYRVRFIQDVGLYRVQFIQDVGLYRVRCIQSSVQTGFTVVVHIHLTIMIFYCAFLTTTQIEQETFEDTKG